MKEWWNRRSRNQKLLITTAGVIVVILAAIDSSNDPDSVASEATTTAEAQQDEGEPVVMTTTDSAATTENPVSTSIERESSEDAFCVREGNSMRINASCFPEDEWPLSTEDGLLICHQVDAVTFTGGGSVYAVNGMAKGRDLGKDIDPIWLDNPAIEGTKFNIGPLIDLGLNLCE